MRLQKLLNVLYRENSCCKRGFYRQNVSCSLATPHYRDICHLTSALNVSGIVVKFVSSINQTSFTVSLQSARKIWKKDGKKAELSSPAVGGDALPDS
jgi:hypothetical protein